MRGDSYAPATASQEKIGKQTNGDGGGEVI